MGTLGQWCDRDTVDSWWRGRIGVGRHIALALIGCQLSGEDVKMCDMVGLS